MRRNGFAKDIIYSQVALYLTLLICILLSPGSLAANSGFSYFGHNHLTIIPFALGFFISDYYLWRAREGMRGLSDYSMIYRGLGVIIPGMAAIVIAPAVGSGPLDLLHRFFGSIVFMTELVLGWWMAARLRKDLLSWLLFGLQILGGLIAAYYLSPPKGYSFEGQSLFQLAFSALLARSLLARQPQHGKVKGEK